MSGKLKPSLAEMELGGGEGVRKLGNGRQSPTSPLKLFGQSKKKINDIFVEISSYIDETNGFLSGVDCEDEIVTADHVEKVDRFSGKVKGIKEMLCRDRMKVAFFGRTSNGKSTVVNAMLKTKILPMGLGHTTNCFVQVEGTDSSESYMLTEDSETRKNVQSITQLAHALSGQKLEPNSLIRVCWPKNKCNLLKDDVILVDSPGIDVTPDLDSWIDKFCLDADVFVLVSNAESTLMQTEKNFFHKVSSKLSKPNIFILNNRWDASASEPENMDEVRQQHMERDVAFIADELKVTDQHEAEERVFFVSAREALIARSHGHGTPTPTGQLLEGYQGRLFEFQNFERKFEENPYRASTLIINDLYLQLNSAYGGHHVAHDIFLEERLDGLACTQFHEHAVTNSVSFLHQECISQSAVQTKFAQHTGNGKIITSELRSIMDDVNLSANNKRMNCDHDRQETREKLDYTEKQQMVLSHEIKEKIKHMTEEVERKVSLALMEEIKRLAVLVDEFERPFFSDQLALNFYRKELHEYVEKGLEQNLQTRCSIAFKTAVNSAEQEMTERLSALLPERTREQTEELLHGREFEVAYRLDCRNLCADFKEDIEFRFSLGISSLISRFMGPKGAKNILAGYTDIPSQLTPMTPVVPSNDGFQQTQEGEVLLAMLSNFTSLYSRTTVGGLAVVGLVTKAAGWRVLAVCAAVYGLVYVYERLTWTNKAKERSFKKQYVNYATNKLKLIVDLTSKNCSHQVQQELTSTFARLGRMVDNTKTDLETDLGKLHAEITKLEEIAGRASYLRNKAGYLDSELNSFIHQYLKPGSQL